MGNDASVAEEGRETAERAPLLEISNLMVRLYKELFGRGPTKARSNLAGRDILICTLEDSLTVAERKMVEMGEYQRLRDTRMYFQHASEDEFIAAVERTFHRKVRSFVSGMDVKKDVAIEVFYFEPAER
jgi:uncharacterized protein YbcI